MKRGLFWGAVGLLIITQLSIADVYDVYTEMPESSSNAIVSMISSAYDIRDLDLFEICVQRAIDLNLENAVPVLLNIYDQTAPENNGSNSREKAVRLNYFTVIVQALGKLGDDDQATMMETTMLLNNDDTVAFYIIRSLGFMTNSSVALDILHDAASWVSTTTLIGQLVESIKLHKNPDSAVYLTTMKLRGNATSMRSVIDEAIEYVLSAE